MKKAFDQSIDETQITFERVFQNYAMGGTTKFQLMLNDEFDQVRYPDYSLHELLK